jgi:uncharacterized membrane protein
MPQLTLAAGIVIVSLLGLIGALIVWYIWTGKIDLRYLVSELDGSASLSRFQFLVFTFVIAMCFLVLTLDSGQFPQVDTTVLGLLGISGGSYVVSKAIQASLPVELNRESPPQGPSPGKDS